MEPIVYIDRQTGKRCIEKVYKQQALNFLYGNHLLARCVGNPLLHVFFRNPLFSYFYGWLQNQPWTKKKIQPFIDAFKIDSSEFLKETSAFTSFNDFFVRKLKPSARPIVGNSSVAVLPADGRYYFYQNISKVDGFVVKEEKFDLNTLLENETLANRYHKGAMVIARLCPSDYHRFHFPSDCIPGETKLINGWLYSVNPIAIQKDIHIFTKNKRTLCELETKPFGKVLFLEIGATSVGTIHQTYSPHQAHKKGAEKGYFSFGASSLILLFEPGAIQFDADLLAATEQSIEIKCLMGQSLGRA